MESEFPRCTLTHYPIPLWPYPLNIKRVLATQEFLKYFWRIQMG